jgi:ABC-type bacteriocin/lantibiotic exporter with double-glycine peptidase domain
MIKTIKRIIFLSGISKIFIFINIIGLTITVLLDVIGIGIVYPFLEFSLNKKDLYIFKNISENNKLFLFLLLIFGIFFIKNIYILLFNYWQKKKLYLFQWNFTNQIYKKYLDYNINLDRHSSEIQTNIGFSYNISLWIMSIFSILSELILLIFITIILLITNVKVTVFMFSTCLFLGLIFNILSKSRLSTWGNKALVSQSYSVKSQIETFSGLKEITVLGIKDFFYKRFSNFNFKLSNMLFRVNLFELFPKIILELVIMFVILTTIFILVDEKFSLKEIIPTLGLFFIASIRLVPMFGKIIVNLNSLNYAKSSVSVLTEIFNFKLKSNLREKKIDNLKYIHFKNVFFSHENSESLKINLKLNSKKFYGIIGESGSGKTTFINLFIGLIYCKSGQIIINKTNIKSCKNNFRKFIGLVSQEVFVINDTLSKNVALGFNDEEIDNEKVLSALKQAGLSEFISKKHKGVEFIISEDAKNISRGQRQRIGIARALYRDPKIIILDEPTSSLDNQTSEKFLKTLDKIRKNKLIIMCTHNLKHLSICDKIIKIENNTAKFL